MSGSDIVGFYDGNGDLHFTRRAMYDAWVHAGRPPINSSGRLKWMQQAAWVAYQNGTGSPADDPSRPDLFPLAHVRFAALDIDPTPYIVARMREAGCERPYDYEPWHWQLLNVRAYPIVDSVPASAIANVIPYPGTEPITEEQFMAGPVFLDAGPGKGWAVFDIASGKFVPRTDEEAGVANKLFPGPEVSEREYQVADNLFARLHEEYRKVHGLLPTEPPVVVEPPKA
jgi:hypothetical protein